MALTNKACETVKPYEKSRKMADGSGLYLEVMPNGSKYWRLKYRFAGKEMPYENKASFDKSVKLKVQEETRWC